MIFSDAWIKSPICLPKETISFRASVAFDRQGPATSHALTIKPDQSDQAAQAFVATNTMLAMTMGKAQSKPTVFVARNLDRTKIR